MVDVEKRCLISSRLFMVAIFVVRWACSYLLIFVFRMVGLRISAKVMVFISLHVFILMEVASSQIPSITVPLANLHT